MGQAGRPAPARKTVVLELFTSEGCSSCPPADALLTRLRQGKSSNGVQIIPLGFHVDYWDYLGWRDRFSSPQYSWRQQEYAIKFRRNGPYTPQMVVDGSEEFVGSDQERVMQAIANAAAAPQPADVELSAADGQLRVRVSTTVASPATVLLALTEDEAETPVRSGENSGRVLHHSAVVRELRVLGQTSNGNFETVVPSPKERNTSGFHAVVMVQDPSSYRIQGAASAPLSSKVGQ